MKKIIVSAKKKRTPKEFQAECLANQLLLESGFKVGTLAHIKYANGKLTIRLGKKLKDAE